MKKIILMFLLVCAGMVQAGEVNGKVVSKSFQYHHPDVKLKDMLKR